MNKKNIFVTIEELNKVFRIPVLEDLKTDHFDFLRNYYRNGYEIRLSLFENRVKVIVYDRGEIFFTYLIGSCDFEPKEILNVVSSVFNLQKEME